MGVGDDPSCGTIISAAVKPLHTVSDHYYGNCVTVVVVVYVGSWVLCGNTWGYLKFIREFFFTAYRFQFHISILSLKWFVYVPSALARVWWRSSWIIPFPMCEMAFLSRLEIKAGYWMLTERRWQLYIQNAIFDVLLQCYCDFKLENNRHYHFNLAFAALKFN